MQPEDIIQAKEWRQLSEEEKALLAPLASTGGEYNILKKMLLFVQEDADDVPAVDPRVQQGLHTHLAKPAPIKGRPLWYAVAASFLLLLFTAYFLWQPRTKPEIATGPVSNPPKSRPADTLSRTPVVPPPAIINGSTEVVKRPDAKALPARKDTTALQQTTAKVSALVSDNSSLLAFVTEVY